MVTVSLELISILLSLYLTPNMFEVLAFFEMFCTVTWPPNKFKPPEILFICGFLYSISKTEDNLCYYLYVSKSGLEYELKAEVYMGDVKEEMQKDEFPKEIAAKIINAISGPNDDDSDNYGFDFELTNSGDGNKFTEYYSLSFTLWY